MSRTVLELLFLDFANVFELGKVDLRRQYDGNFTGVFTPRVCFYREIQ